MLRRLLIALGLLSAIALGAYGSWNIVTADAGAETDARRLVGLVAFGLAALLLISTRFVGRFWTLRLVLLVLIAMLPFQRDFGQIGYVINVVFAVLAIRTMWRQPFAD